MRLFIGFVYKLPFVALWQLSQPIMNFAGINHGYTELRASLVAPWVKNAPAMQETPVRFLGWEDPLEKG